MPRWLLGGTAVLAAVVAFSWPQHEVEGLRSSIAAVAQDDPLAPRAKGRVGAPITVYEMSDFQCPYCRKHALETFPAIEREYITPGKVRWVFVNLPLPMHPNAVPAAEVAMCASQQGGFWPVHDLLFAHQETWAPLTDPSDFLLSLADSAGMNRQALAECLDDKRMRTVVQADAQGAVRAGATSTPTFYIEGGLLVGAYPIEDFRVILDSVYQAKTSLP